MKQLSLKIDILFSATNKNKNANGYQQTTTTSPIVLFELSLLSGIPISLAGYQELHQPRIRVSSKPNEKQKQENFIFTGRRPKSS
jgi:hypothetical protein